MTDVTPVPAVPKTTAPLLSGAAMPLLGFGTWQLRGSAAREATGHALAVGYRHVDTATMYRNEREVGDAVRASGLSRDEVFLTTKLPPDRSDQPRRTLKLSLEQLQVDQVDLWLVHWPPRRGAGVELWRAFGQARDEGLVRDIGVSNYSLSQIDELTDATGVTPAVNQIEWSPLLFDQAVLDGHQQRGVVLEGYSALRGGTLDHPVIVRIAERLGRTPAQVIVRWHLEHGVVVIPKSANPDRIRSNADVEGFTLPPEDVAALDALSQP